MRISKISLAVRFGKESAEILRVKEKAYISKSAKFAGHGYKMNISHV